MRRLEARQHTLSQKAPIAAFAIGLQASAAASMASESVDVCQRTGCINRCSGHGRCVRIGNMATKGYAVPISSTDYQYSGLEYTKTWMKTGKRIDLLLPPYTVMITHFICTAMRNYRLYGCVCDNSWTVGLAATQTQGAEWFGLDCSMRRYPGGQCP
jgi:hypothetical protein